MNSKNLFMVMIVMVTMSMMPSKSMANNWDRDYYDDWLYDEYPDDDLMQAMDRDLRTYINYNINKWRKQKYVTSTTRFIYEGTTYHITYSFEDIDVFVTVQKGGSSVCTGLWVTYEESSDRIADQMLFSMYGLFGMVQ